MPKDKICLYLPKNFLKKIITHAQKEYPLECCGLLAGKRRRIIKAYPMQNKERSSSSYLMDPEEQYQVFQQIEGEKLELLAIYHSHPFTPAYPSAKDIDLAFYPEALMVIISLIDYSKPSINLFQVKQGKVKKGLLKIWPSS